VTKKRRTRSPRAIRMMNDAFFDETGQRWDFVRTLSRTAPTQLRATLFSRGSLRTLVLVVED
jgi:hypothetical protein